MRTAPRLVAVVAATVALLAGCSSPTPQDEVLTDLGLDGLSGQEIVTRLDASSESRPLDFTASVREDEVLLGDGTTEVAVPLQDGEFYVSIAPFVDTTHECFFHSLATCQGELVEEPVDVTITTADGEVLVEESTTTHTNGFVGFWLPEDVEGTIEVRQGDRMGSVPFSTAEGSPTCVTTLRLA
ncbi:CueP family metal-binding protein [uncultured Cellulomonas sp.]|uniref:CueP family metal-binding protein n=1 Tax=uncultured Cellulomonas sp. TaxID=189682 RepID=UPI0028F02C73|nr:CueP family metal-binding protein [uncultured Cellulomonas sp.]